MAVPRSGGGHCTPRSIATGTSKDATRIDLATSDARIIPLPRLQFSNSPANEKKQSPCRNLGYQTGNQSAAVQEHTRRVPRGGGLLLATPHSSSRNQTRTADLMSRPAAIPLPSCSAGIMGAAVFGRLRPYRYWTYDRACTTWDWGVCS